MEDKQNRSTGTGARVRHTKVDLIGDAARCQQWMKVISYIGYAEGFRDSCKPLFGNC